MQAASLPNVSTIAFTLRMDLPYRSTKSWHLSMYTHLAKVYSTSCISTAVRAEVREVDEAIGVYRRSGPGGKRSVEVWWVFVKGEGD